MISTSSDGGVQIHFSALLSGTCRQLCGHGESSIFCDAADRRLSPRDLRPLLMHHSFELLRGTGVAVAANYVAAHSCRWG